MRKILVSSLFAASLAVSLSSFAWAQADEFDKKADDAIAADKQNKEEAGKKMPGEKDPPKASDKPDPKWDPKEESGKAYRFIGGGFRNFIVPKFMINIFADGGTTVNAFSFRPVELTIRKDRTEYDFALSYTDFSMNPFMFKGKKEGPTSYELVASSMKAIGLTVDLLYDFPIDDKGRFDFMIGGGVGILGIFGNLYRSQAHPRTGTAGDPADPQQWQPCPGQTTDPYCDGSNNHFTNGDSFPAGSYDEPSWANGGSKPFIMPYISLPQLSLRFKPIKQIQTRADVGFSIFGFYMGLTAGYGFSP